MKPKFNPENFLDFDGSPIFDSDVEELNTPPENTGLIIAYNEDLACNNNNESELPSIAQQLLMQKMKEPRALVRSIFAHLTQETTSDLESAFIRQFELNLSENRSKGHNTYSAHVLYETLNSSWANSSKNRFSEDFNAAINDIKCNLQLLMSEKKGPTKKVIGEKRKTTTKIKIPAKKIATEPKTIEQEVLINQIKLREALFRKIKKTSNAPECYFNHLSINRKITRSSLNTNADAEFLTALRENWPYKEPMPYKNCPEILEVMDDLLQNKFKNYVFSDDFQKAIDTVRTVISQMSANVMQAQKESENIIRLDI